MVKSRVPMQVSVEFEKRLKQLQERIMRTEGKNISLRELTKKISRSMDFDTMERSLVDVTNFDIKIPMDRRKRK